MCSSAGEGVRGSPLRSRSPLPKIPKFQMLRWTHSKEALAMPPKHVAKLEEGKWREGLAREVWVPIPAIPPSRKRRHAYHVPSDRGKSDRQRIKRVRAGVTDMADACFGWPRAAIGVACHVGGPSRLLISSFHSRVWTARCQGTPRGRRRRKVSNALVCFALDRRVGR